MARPALLSEGEITNGLAELPGWEREDHALVRSYRFGSFGEAMGFMVRAGMAAERLDHHPDWSNSYRDVHVRLTTHRAQDGAGLTRLDLALAAAMDTAAGERNG